MARQLQQLSDAVEDFLRFRKSSDIAANTIRTNRTTLMRFLAVNGNIWCNQIDESHVMRYFEEASKTRSASSMSNDYDHLSLFFDWARQTKRMGSDADPMYGRRKPKRTKKERNRLHVSRFGALLDAAGQRSPRDRVAVALLLYTLARDKEITGLRIRDLNLEAGYLKVRVFKSRTEDMVPICAELDAELRRWLTHYTEQVGFLEPHYFLAPARKTKPVMGAGGIIVRHDEVAVLPDREISALSPVVQPALEGVGFPIRDETGASLREGAHTIRRSGARALFDQLVTDSYDGALRVVQSLLHHESMSTSERYIGLGQDRLNRDKLIKGRTMYSLGGNVTELRREA